MGKVSIDINSFKAAGIYTLEVDETVRSIDSNTDALRMLVGFSNKGTFNRPVLVTEDTQRLRMFGDVDTKLEHKGCYFNRMLRTLLTGGPVIALNLLKVDDSYGGPDQVNLALLSMNAGEANPAVKGGMEDVSYGEYDYLADSVDKIIYGTNKGDNIPYVAKTPYASLYNRSRFWIPDKDLLNAEAARNLGVSENMTSFSFEKSNLLNFANVGTDEISILVFKPTSMPGYEVTADSWFGGKENIPFGWIRPYDNISDYFLQVICVKGNWSNYPVLSTDPVWKGYFDKNGIKKNRINQFLAAEGITVLGAWTGCIIPDFTDKQGNMLNLERKVNAQTESTGLLMSFNNDLANVLMYDYSGVDAGSSDPDSGEWGLDIDGSGDVDSEAGEYRADYIVDMVGHNAFMEKPHVEKEWVDSSILNVLEEGQYVYNSKKNKFTEVPVRLREITYTDEDSSIDIYDASKENVENTVKSGKFVESDLIKSVDPEEPLLFTKANVASLVKNNYYQVSPTGVLSAKTLYVDVEIADEDAQNGDVEISAFFSLDASTFKQDYTVTVQTAEDSSTTYITAAAASGDLVFQEDVEENGSSDYYGINFLSYNYIQKEDDGVEEKIEHVKYFSDPTIWADEAPLAEDNKNIFIITDASQWVDAKVKLGDYVHNITYKNLPGETEQYQLIPGLSRVIRKQFVQVNENDGKVTYQGKPYKYVGEYDQKMKGFYMITCTSPVLIEDDTIMRQLPISDDRISSSLRFIPMKGLTVTSRHRPGYDASGNLNIEEGIEKIYSVIEDEGIKRGLMNPTMVNYRYIVDSMSYGLGNELGGKVHLSRTAMNRGKCTAILNLPSAKQFAVSSNPYFCDTYIPGSNSRPAMNTKYIPEGGNTEMGSTIVFSLPSEENGAKFTGCFWPNLIYQEGGKTISVPPAADVANVLSRKFNGINDPYAICANTNGIISNRYLKDVEFPADLTDREYLEPFGVDTIIKDEGQIMIYGNQTAYQAMKSDFNKLHIRENLNTAEIECERVIKKYNFLYNTPATRANIVQQLTPVLQAMQISGALAKYEIICNEKNNTPEIISSDICVVEVNLWMNHGMEKIIQKFTLRRLSDQ